MRWRKQPEHVAGLRIPVLVVHRELDACPLRTFSDASSMLDRLVRSSRREWLAFRGGVNEGDPCEAFAYHGYNGIEFEVVKVTGSWIPKVGRIETVGSISDSAALCAACAFV